MKTKHTIIILIIVAGIAITAAFFGMRGKETVPVFDVFFGSTPLGSGEDCVSVFPLRRETSDRDNLPVSALASLLKGPTQEEKDAGYFTSINSGVSIKSFRVENTVAFVDFDSEVEREMGGSCRVSAIRSQIGKTLEQFPEIDGVVISVEGRTEDILQP
ncbi:MAG TPA: GerMN domain-containing protein [Candidatus Paceibacterota bacterium]